MKKYLSILWLNIICIYIYPYEGLNFSTLGVKNGVYDNYIHDLLQDDYGFMWFITTNGLSRYDGYNFKYYPIDPQGNDTYYINEDANKNMWIQAGENYFLYNREKDIIEKDISHTLQDLNIPEQVEILFIDHDKNLWCSDGNTLIYHDFSIQKQSRFQLSASEKIKWLECRNGQAYILFTNGQVKKIDFESNKMLSEISIPLSTYSRHKMYLDYAYNLWFYTEHAPEDVLRYYNPGIKELRNFKDGNNRDYNFVTCVIDDGKGNIWIGTDNAGIIVYNTSTDQYSAITYKQNNPFSILSNHIECFYLGRQNIMWVGTSKRGIAYASLDNTFFKRYNISEQDDISCVLEDQEGNLWLGSDGEGITKVEAGNHNQVNFNLHNGDIPEDLIVCSFLDSKDRIWFGTYGGGVCFYEKGRFVNLNYDETDGIENPLKYIRSIDEDKAGNIWIGTIVKGLYCYNTNGEFTNYTVDKTPLQSSSITDLYCHRGQKLYIGTSAGLCVMDTYSRQISRISGTINEKQSLADSFVNCLYRDSRGLLWIGGKKGVSILDEVRDSIIYLNTDNGLSHNFIKAIAEDHNKNIWITTDLGVTNVVVVNDPMSPMPTFRCYRYYEEDGLGDIAFNNHSLWCSRNGEILMGGIGGYIKAYPESIPNNPYEARVEFTALYIANKRIEVGESINGGGIILHKNIQLLDEIYLDYSNNNFFLDVSSLDYQALHKTIFAYRLGDDAEWIRLNGNTIHFNELSPGTYNLQVKIVNNNGHQDNKHASLLIHIKPPFWLSIPAYVLYFILFCIAIIAIIMYMRRKDKFKIRMQKLEMEMAQQHEMDEAKMRFFTNVSHDLRTPLSLIISPLEKLISSPVSENQAKEDLKLMHRNALILMSEVNQLLDLRRLENGKAELNLSHGNLLEYIKEICNSFEPYSNKKGIQIKLISKASSIEMDFDRNKIRRVFMNLLSNAFKFNIDNGSITVTLDRIINTDGEKVRIQVADTGIGIREENKNHIFERFYQETNASAYIGSGIGLHIVKEYVNMHGGDIEVRDNSPQGSVFIVTLPITETIDRYIGIENEENSKTEENEDFANKYPILVVEDNDDFRQFIIDCLKDHYPVISASNGKKALAIMAQQQVRLVISDVMMPVMDGLELCNKIKGDIRFSHIPVILLTARAADEHVLSGLKEGADDYITKPFNLEILLLRIEKLLEWGKNNHQKFKTIEVEPNEITISSLDEQLIDKAIKFVEENIDNTEFSVEDLSSAVGMTRGHLYKKLMMITGKSPIEFIRTIRIKRGKQLLEKSQLSVSEIAYNIGLSPKQFAKYFKDVYGELPSIYKKRESE